MATIGLPRCRFPGARQGSLSVGLTLALTAAAAPAHAQNVGFDPDTPRDGIFSRNQNVSVLARPQPGYEPKGIRVGSFDLYGALTGGVAYQDNVFATKTDKKDDLIFTVVPTAVLQSNWNVHRLQIFGRGTINRFLDNTSQDSTLYSFGSEGQLDIRRGSAIQAGVQYSHSVIERTSTRFEENTLRPIEYDDLRGFVGGAFGFNRIRLATSLTYDEQNFSNNPDLINERRRDRNVITGTARVEYAVSPSISGYVNFAGSGREFPNVPATNVARDSKQYEVTVGTNFELPTLMRGKLAVGYLWQNFDDAALRDYKGIAFHGQLEYFPTQLVTLTAYADRDIEDAATDGGGSYVTSNYSLRADYELLRNVILSAQGGYGRDDFQTINLHYDRAFGTVEARYRMNRGINMRLQYQFQKRNALGSSGGREFTFNQIAASMTYQF